MRLPTGVVQVPVGRRKRATMPIPVAPIRPGAGRTVEPVFLIEVQQRFRTPPGTRFAPRKSHGFEYGCYPGGYRFRFAKISGP
ncbi:hypothetical protein GK091_24855 [Spirosoma agri]|uniref:Uncharacterized protein n=1 Tax=Spirosoma agri TaxID=1987381 RepID=A0A6M0IP32_9BACT|nr:hypothetical protein [Spirosoma agri]NEU70130.1 hypothetical protein [Spirosoma agri]